MPLPKPAFFQSDKRPQWRSALAGLAVGLRLRFRKNPGFTMAAGAGSIGLLLALFLLLNGGLARFSKSPSEVPDTETDLGVAAAGPESKSEDDGKSAAEERDRLASFEQDRPSRDLSQKESTKGRLAGNAREREDSLLNDDTSDADSEVSVVTRATDSSRTRDVQEKNTASDPFNADGMTDSREEDDEEPTVAKPAKAAISSTTIAGLHDDSEEEVADDTDSIASTAKEEEELPTTEPIANEVEAAPKEEALPPKVSKPRKPEPLFADDEPSGGSAEDDEVRPAARPNSTTIVKTPSKASPPVPPISETDDGSFMPPESNVIESSSPAATSQSKSGWKYSTTKPQTKSSSPQTEGRSQAVETAVYAAPEASPSTVSPKRIPEAAPQQREVPAVEKKTGSPLTLAIRAPRNIAPGQTFDLEFVINNTGREPVRDVILSVLLPAGLSHDLGPELEQPIDSLAAGQTHRARLRVKATGAGDVTPRADVAIKGQPKVTSTSTLRVGSTGGAPTSTIPPCACEPPVRYVW